MNKTEFQEAKANFHTAIQARLDEARQRGKNEPPISFEDLMETKFLLNAAEIALIKAGELPVPEWYKVR